MFRPAKYVKDIEFPSLIGNILLAKLQSIIKQEYFELITICESS